MRNSPNIFFAVFDGVLSIHLESASIEIERGARERKNLNFDHVPKTYVEIPFQYSVIIFYWRWPCSGVVGGFTSNQASHFSWNG